MIDPLPLLQALAEPTRLRIVAMLRAAELSVGELAVVLDQSQPRVSRHVRILADAGLVARSHEGSWVFLRLAKNPAVQPLLQLIADWPGLDTAMPELASDRARLATVMAQRAAAAERYFADHADQWDQIRQRHVGDTAVEAAMLGLIDPVTVGDLLDIGTGTGRIAQLLAPRARSITVLDRSPDMLRLARVKLADSPVPTSLVQGDFCSLPLPTASADTVTLHQVLHFAEDPATVLAEAGRVLRPGGHLLIADFAPHQEEELRDIAAHVRMGFSDDQIGRWLTTTGLTVSGTVELASAPLTVKLWLARRTDTPRTRQSQPAPPAESDPV